jgi:hypothetical protein
MLDSEKQWYYVVASGSEMRQEGPVSSQDLESMLSEGRLSTDTLVWNDGMTDWAQIGAVTDFSPPVSPDDSPAGPEPIPAKPSIVDPPADTATPVKPNDTVTIKDTGNHSIQFSRSRNVLLIATNDYHAGPLVLTKLDLLRLLTVMETLPPEG